MGLFVRDDTYDESQRMTGFNRYKQLLSFYGLHWLRLGIITFLSTIPLIIGIGYALLSTSLLLALIFGAIGGAIMGPFIAALVDNMYRAFREAPCLGLDIYKKGLVQNLRCSLIPGAVLGLFAGVYSFIFYLNFYANAINVNTYSWIALLIAFAFFINLQNLLWPQLVLFNQPLRQTLINIILFSSKYFWMTLKVAIQQIIFIGFHVILAPYTILLLPFLSIWYYIFFSQQALYDTLDAELHIEEKFHD